MNRIALAHLFVTQELIASKLSFSFLALLLCLIFFTNGSAQNGATTATLAGVVRDAAGASVSGATVTLRNLATNQTRQTESAADGTYRLSALPVGVYEVRAEAEGFARYTNPQVTVELGRAQVLDITLQPASLSAEVTVNDRPPALDVSQQLSAIHSARSGRPAIQRANDRRADWIAGSDALGQRIHFWRIASAQQPDLN
ncbi:MAG: hypothetical protein AUG51_15560 [Acidobacteria bacterium 13_1_20CM_3_53_8]|nr:MAG: hypothetical protein AUG51_15560 [Acidobacteria bacterium 13_1_20CM_3_53_8]